MKNKKGGSPNSYKYLAYLSVLYQKMASRIIKFDGIESNINEKQLGLTVKLTPTQYGQTSYEGVFAALDKAGLKALDILGLYKVSQNDSSYCLIVGNGVLDSLMDKHIIGENKAKFNIISYDRANCKAENSLASVVLRQQAAKSHLL